MSSSSSPPLCNYDVFISFRGEDTRTTIVSHLYKELVRKGITTFRDKPEIKMGDPITQTLIGVINNSKFAVVVISKNFATSTWCLDELQLIMELVTDNKMEVIPIFYGVIPGDVRHHRGSFDLDMYQNHKMAEKIPKWREALSLIADRSGQDSGNLCEDEAKMVEDIAQRISKRLASMLAKDLGVDIIGVEEYMKGLRPYLEMESKVRMIGICGIKGIGKTTIANYLYEQHKQQFSPHHSFLESIGDVVKIPKDLLELQRKLISDVLGEQNVELSNTEHGARYIKSRLENLKVLLVLDDVNDGEQLHYLAREARSFGSGSLIIITTRDKTFLRSYGVNSAYDVVFLDDEKALQLFKETAFQGEIPPSDDLYNDLSLRISRLAQGLPSKLKAFGLCVRGKSLVGWQDDLRSFEKAAHENVMRIFRVSYEKLDEFGRTIFLHVACLFNGDYMRRVMPLFDQGVIGMSVLVQKSLVELSPDGVILMPALVEKMGKEIVRQESDKNPANQRILWLQDDIFPVVADKSGTLKTEGFTVDVGEMLGKIPNCIDIEWSVFKQMHNLMFLKIYNNSESGKASLILEANPYVPHNLRLLHWDAYPFTVLPSMIQPDYLVELNLCYSKLTTLWSKTPRLVNLRKMDLTGSKDLKQLPDLQEAMYLEELILECCSSLKGIPNSICSLSRLQKLDVSNCDGLKRTRIKIRESETTVFQGRSLRVRSVQLALLDAEPPQGISLTNLSIKGKLNIEFQLLGGYAEYLCFVSVQQNSCQFMMLEEQTHELTLPPYGCKSLDIMRFHCNEKSDHFKCVSFSGFPWLMDLNLINLNIQEIPDDIHQMVVLEKLDLSGNSFKVLPTTMGDLKKLKHLNLCNCRKLEELPELYQLETLTLSDCTTLKTLVTPLYQQHSYSLLKLWLDNCKNVESLSDQLTRFQNLTFLDISRHNFESVPTSIKDITSLVTLCVNYCDNLKSLTELPQSLKCLKAHGCNSLDTSFSSIDHSLDLDLDPCLHPNQKSSQITRFPAGRCGDEVPMCACFKETTVPGTYEQPNWNPLSILWQLITPWLWGFAIGIIVLCLHGVLRVTGIDPFTSTTAIFRIYLNTLAVAILLYQISIFFQNI